MHGWRAFVYKKTGGSASPARLDRTEEGDIAARGEPLERLW
jgi:hypothetical protein